MNNIFTIKLNGKLDQISIVDYNIKVTELFDTNKEAFILILDMTEVSYMNSTAIGHVAEWYNKLNDIGGQISIVGANENIEDTLDIVGLASRIKLFKSIDDFKTDYLNK